MSAAQVLILAAGRGERMRPLTDTCPKPLLRVQGKPLLAWHLDALARAGYHDVCINTAYLGSMIPAALGAAHVVPKAQAVFGHPLRLHYSREDVDFGHALETAGGIVRALPQLADVFWVLAGDVYTPQFGFDGQAYDAFAQSDALAHIWLVPNPPHNTKGDFGITPEGNAYAPIHGSTPVEPSTMGLAEGGPSPSHIPLAQTAVVMTPLHTYSTIGLYKKALFAPPYCNIPLGNPEGGESRTGAYFARSHANRPSARESVLWRLDRCGHARAAGAAQSNGLNCCQKPQ